MMAEEKRHHNRVESRAIVLGAMRHVLFGSAAKYPEGARDIDLACDGIVG
jgi:hypothetical protein